MNIRKLFFRSLPDSQTTKRNVEVFDTLDLLAQAIQHISDHGQHLTRYYGWYSNGSRGERAGRMAPLNRPHPT